MFIRLLGSTLSSADGVTTTGAMELVATDDYGTVDISSAAGGITIGGPVDGAVGAVANLNLDSGSDGDITFLDDVGTDVRLTRVKVTIARDVTFSGGVLVDDYTQLAGTGTIDAGTAGLGATDDVAIKTRNVIGTIVAGDDIHLSTTRLHQW